MDLLIIRNIQEFVDKKHLKFLKKVLTKICNYLNIETIQLLKFYLWKENYQMEEKEVLLTQEGYDNLEKEVEYLRTEKRAEIAERIKVALGFGDLSENSEYDEAKNAQADNEVKIANLEAKLRYAKIIDESEIDTKTVQVGNTVKVKDLEFDEEEEYTIVGSTEVDLSQNKISNESPIGSALLGAKKGEEIEVNVPAGVVKYKILSIKK
jgi:transcription elongation factor GreA